MTSSRASNAIRLADRPPEPTDRNRRSRDFWRCTITFGIVVVALMAWTATASRSSLVRAELAYGAREYESAMALAAAELQSDPKSDRALMIAGSVLIAKRDFAAARNYFSRISESDPFLFSKAQLELGRIAILAGQASEAESRLRTAYRLNPSDPGTLDQLIFLMTLEGRSWESRQLALQAIQSGMATPNYLQVAMTHRPNLEIDVKFANHCLAVIPSDPITRLTLAKKAWLDNLPDEARQQVSLVLERYPDLLEAHALLGQILVEVAAADFPHAWKRLPANADEHPEIWLVQGIWAENQGQLQAAARCYWEAVRREPNLPNANYRLSQVLVRLQQPEPARIFATRAERITTLLLETNSFYRSFDPTQLPQIVRQLEELGRHWEAAGWCEVAAEKVGQLADWARSTQLRLHDKLLSSTSYTSIDKDPTRNLDLSSYPLPEFKASNPPPESFFRRGGPLSEIRFEDAAEHCGLKFTYVNGAPGGDLESMLEMNGGGVAVLDYDQDHWPDVYFTQGGSLPPAAFDPSISDRLFRNREGESPATRRFEDVTDLSGIRDLGYGQGVTVGDFNNDGFPDLYVGNIGRNQFYVNNGDGTFTDVTAVTGTQAGGWTSSCVMADFNQDGLPDLYVVTYLGGEAPFVLCKKRTTKRCAPLAYPAEADRFYLNLGDGRFRDLSETCGLAAPEGRGLGVLAADFDGSRRLSLFVANDMSANFYFHNQTQSPETPKFVEQAMLSGLAFDHMGRIKACMGVAAGDYNRDRRLDLFVTNFYRESNDLFTQLEDGTFTDRSREAKLYDPSFLQLGWGTQFLDADLDGHLDLIVTNGHVHDPLEAGVPYQMPAQFFRNQGDATFAEIPSRQLGPFFEQKWLGRPLARLDWNRDGLEDVCISHLNEPAALLSNRTARGGHWTAFRLVAVDSARDAIGTSIKITIGDEVWVGQLTAGDGFQATNERRLTFGMGVHRDVTRIEIRWPSGTVQEFNDLTTDREWILIEHHLPIQSTVLSRRIESN